jgi:hypothetical protein
MGLLSIITTKEKQPKSGLLSRASSLSLGTSVCNVDFVQWCAEQGFEHAGIFSPIHRIFVLHDAVGLDAETITRSVSSSDFWEGSLESADGWNTFSKEKNTLSGFFQLFSSGFKPSLTKIHFLPLEKNNHKIIFMIAETDSSIQLPSVSSAFKNTLFDIVNYSFSNESQSKFDDPLSRGLAQYDAHLFLLSVKLGIDTILKNIELPEKDIRNQAIATMLKEITFITSRLFQDPCCVCMGTNGEIKIVLFSHNEPDETLLQFHLTQSLKPFLGNTGASSVLLLSAGTCRNVKSASSFLLQG